MKNLWKKKKVLEYFKALPAKEITLKVFINLIFNIQSVHEWPLVVRRDGWEGGWGWKTERGRERGCWPLWKCKKWNIKSIYFSQICFVTILNFLILNLSKGLLYIMEIFFSWGMCQYSIEQSDYRVFRCGYSGLRTLKPAVSQEWSDELNTNQIKKSLS